MNAPSAWPLVGYPLVVVLRGAATTLLWGEDVDGRDVVATEDGRVRAWSSPDDCVAEVLDKGWEVADEEPTWMDLTPALEWHARQRRVLDPDAGLNAWNLAGDVARSTGTSWGDRGRLADTCHGKLTVACVPYLARLDTYTPRWSVAQERYLRRRLGAAFGLFAQQFPRRLRRGPAQAVGDPQPPGGTRA